ncbi:P1 family peptidase [Pseudarthrobacter sp. NPDC092424]|uniref:P1 family peptidase n=1 Tax=Pseudarthrobacter sp. NPDC092424 TaxID=3364415 RepID=UPI003822B2DE
MRASGSITDVPGIRVGNEQKTGDGWLTGVTVILPPPGTVGSVDVRGGGPATHETDALDPTTTVRHVDAVVLTGGSAYGLATAAGAQRWCEEHGRGFAVPGGVVPIVPAAAIFDLGRGGDFSARPTPEMGYAAIVAAAAQEEGREVARGNVGAGTGALIGRGKFKGGLGMASATLEDGIIVGALAVVNALGLPFRTTTLQPDPGHGAPLNTTLVVVATNAVLDVAECKRTASASHAGLARALNPSHTLADGDTVFCLATGGVALGGSDEAARRIGMITLQSAAADVVRSAVLDGVARAEAVGTPAGEYGVYRTV